MVNKKQKLIAEKKRVLKQSPSLGDVLRGTFKRWYSQCGNPGCKCHTDNKYLHGPYYRVSYNKRGKVYTLYVPLKLKEEVKRLVDNYNKVWKGIEDISAINIKLIRLSRSEKYNKKK